MQKVQFNNMEEEYNAYKQESVQFLVKQPIVIEALQKLQLTQSAVEEFWIDFLNYYNDHKDCINCNGIEQCPKVVKGMKKVIEHKNGLMHTALEACVYGERILEDQLIIQAIPLKNVDDRILLTKSKDLTMLAYQNSNAKEVLKIFGDYIENPSKKGFFIQGNPGVGKSTILGMLIRALVTKGYRCGYIHFPTFLIDLKSSFGQEGIYESINLMKNIDFLAIDDIGGESVTTWSRDEILSSVLAYRAQNGKATFFTSVYSIDELKKYYTMKQSDAMQVNRLLDRMKAVSNTIILKGPDLR